MNAFYICLKSEVERGTMKEKKQVIESYENLINYILKSVKEYTRDLSEEIKEELKDIKKSEEYKSFIKNSH